MEHEFTAGQKVRLKSGGPEMTIESIDNYGMSRPRLKAKCTWFDGTKRQSELFELAALEPVE